MGLRSEFTAVQLSHIMYVYAGLLHDPHIPVNAQTLCAKMMFNMTEAIVGKDTPEGAAVTVNFMMQTYSDKMRALVSMADFASSRVEKQKASKEEEDLDISFIEKERPTAKALYATENPEEVLKGELKSKP